MVFAAILALMGLMLFGLLFYLRTRLGKYECIRRLGVRGKLIAWLAPLLLSLGFVGIAGIGLLNAFILLLHLAAIWALTDLGFAAAARLSKRKNRYFWQGIVALALTICVLGGGWHSMRSVQETCYSFSMPKAGNEELRIIQIADLHLSTIMDGDDFAAELAKMQAWNPDILVITGDFVDDGSRRDDLTTACRALGNFETRYGIYFAYGNHDRGYQNSRDFTAAELEQLLLESGVHILQDETANIGNRFTLTGREDRSVRSRKTMQELMQGIDPSKCAILLDHQPNDYANEAAAGVDLVLSGHTHGGHMFPAGLIGLLMGANDKVYGVEKIEDTTFVVSSGISGWTVPFKTGAISEYVVIDIK